MSPTKELMPDDEPNPLQLPEPDPESAGMSQGTQAVEEKTKDLNVVDWDSPNDPQNPQNWPHSKRIMHVALVSTFALLANLAATMYSPGASLLAKDFHITNSMVATFTVSIYILGFAAGPFIVAPLSELYGRLYLYHVCNITYLSFTLGCAKSTDTAMFMVFRFIAGCAAAAPVTIGGGTIADVIPVEKRGGAMAIYAMGPLLGPVMGPIIGGFLSQGLGWRWSFWLIAIISGTTSLAALIFMRETYASVILRRKAARLRKETGNPNLVAKSDLGQDPSQLLLLALYRPIKMLVFSPMVLLLSLYCALLFGLIFILFTTFPAVFEEQYGWSTGVSGLAYLGLGIGMFSGIIIFSQISDKLLKPKPGEVPKPEVRLVPMMWFFPTVPIGLFWYGWTVQEKTHWIAPIIGTSLIGVGVLFVIIPAQLYLIDCFGARGAASALAANTAVRTLAGAFLPLAGPPLYDNLHYGWGNTLLGLLVLLFAPVPFLFWRYGESLRKRFVFTP